MFAARYFAPRYFAPRYFPEIGGAALGFGFCRHYTGVLVPLGTFPASHYSADYSVFDQFVPDPVSSARYTSNAIDTGFDDDLRVQLTPTTQLGPGQSGTPTLNTSLDTWLTGESDPQSFTPWTIGFVLMRFMRGSVEYDSIAAGAVSFLKSFVITADTAPKTEQGGSFDVGIGGSVLTFPEAFHSPPFMPAPNVLLPTGAGYYATATAVSATQCRITIFDSTGTSVAGTVSWSATGE